jgi:hypothetical protein
MKKILALVAAVSAFGFAIPATSEANDWGHTRIVSYLRCGRPVVANYQLYGYDRCGNPLGRWVTQHTTCGCSVCNPRPACSPYSHGHFGGVRHIRTPIVPVAPCAPRSGVSWFFSFGR